MVLHIFRGLRKASRVQGVRRLLQTALTILLLVPQTCATTTLLHQFHVRRKGLVKKQDI